MKKIRALAAIPVLAAAVAGIGLGQNHSASAASCYFSYYPGRTAVYFTPTTGTFYWGGGAGVAAFYLDPFGVLQEASPYGPTAVYFSSTYGFWNISGEPGVTTICTQP